MHNKTAILLAMALAALIWVLANATAQVRFPVGNDAIGYMTDATNFLQGRGITRVVNETEAPDIDYAPTLYQPPGFALAISALAALGLSVESAAFMISRAAWLLLPFALMFALLPILHFGWAAAVTVLVVFSPGIYLNGSTISTDLPTLLLIVTAIGMMIRGIEQRPRIGLLITAGLLLGVAYSLRNSVTAVLMAMVAAYAGAPLLRVIPVSAALRNCGWMLLGSAAVITLLLARNILVFGEAQPYVLMVGEHATLLESFRVFLHGLFWDITGSPTLAKYVAWDFKILAALAMVLLAFITRGLLRGWRDFDPATCFALLFGALFCFASASMLVIAHTYHGLDFGYLLRHMMQFAWLLLSVTLVTLLALGGLKVRLALALVVAILLVSRLWFIVDDLRVEHAMQQAFAQNTSVVEAARPFLTDGRILTEQIKQRLAQDAAIPAAIQALPKNALILSNQGPLLGYLAARPVRALPLPSVTDLSSVIERVTQVFHEMRGDRPVYLVFVPDNRVVRDPAGMHWQSTITGGLPAHYQVVGAGINHLIILVPPPLREKTVPHA